MPRWRGGGRVWSPLSKEECRALDGQLFRDSSHARDVLRFSLFDL